jgi:hypothetical protein
MKLFLDDIREPKDCLSYMFQRIGTMQNIYSEEWVVVRNYEQFVEKIKNHHKQITHISYDHDLAEQHYTDKMYDSIEEYYKSIEGTEKTGFDAAKYMKDFYDNNDIKYPIMFVHSMNPAGTQNIVNLFK